MIVFDWLYYWLSKIIDKFSRPRQTFGKETEEVLKWKKYYEEQANETKNNDAS